MLYRDGRADRTRWAGPHVTGTGTASRLQEIDLREQVASGGPES